MALDDIERESTNYFLFCRKVNDSNDDIQMDLSLKHLSNTCL